MALLPEHQLCFLNLPSSTTAYDGTNPVLKPQKDHS